MTNIKNANTANTRSSYALQLTSLPLNRSVSYSCSDKVCRWNHVGWQGSWLSRLLEDLMPVLEIRVFLHQICPPDRVVFLCRSDI
eukprot:6108216-Amphidinium_carterae.1